MKNATAVVALIAATLAAPSADAQTVTIVVGYSPGASYDIYMRNFARHLGKHLPGNPNVIAQNMAGAGSLRSANFIFNTAPKDGTTLGVFARGLAMQPLLDKTGIQYDAAEVQLDRQHIRGREPGPVLAYEAVQDHRRPAHE